MIDIFLEARETDAEVDRCNAAAPAGAPHLSYVELTARNLERFTRDTPSLAETVTLFDWKNSGKQIWPPTSVPLGVLMAASMAPAHDPRYTDRWFEAQGDRRAEQEAERQRTAEYYDRQEQERQDREAREAALEAEERQRSGYP
jgi:hypothetical protein